MKTFGELSDHYPLTPRSSDIARATRDELQQLQEPRLRSLYRRTWEPVFYLEEEILTVEPCGTALGSTEKWSQTINPGITKTRIASVSR